MGKVYSHSFCTIAAAAASDCHGGLFPRTSELPILSTSNPTSDTSNARSVIIKPHYADWDDLFLLSKLNSRGWTLQERELSPGILHFVKHTMLFECKEARGWIAKGSRSQEKGEEGF